MRHDRHVSIWSREFVLLFGSCVLFWAAFLLYLPTIPVYMVRYLHSSPALVGLVTGLTALAAVVIRPFAGYAVDRWGRRWVYCACLLAFSGACFSYILATDLRTLVVVRLLFGLPFGVATVAGMTIAGDVAPPGRRGEAVGLFALAQTISMALAPVAAFEILGVAQFPGLFVTAGCLALAAFLLALLARYPPIRDPGSTLSLRSLLEPQAVPPALTVACQGLAYGGVTGFLSLYGQELRIPNVGVCWLTYALGHAAARAASAKAFDRHGPRQLVLMGYALLMASFVCLALWRTAAGFAAAGLILGLGWALTFPTLQTMALEQVAPARRGASSATFFNGFDLGVFSGSYAMAFVAQAAGGYSGMYLVAAALLLAPVVLFLALTLPRYRPWKPAP